jgi:hypothetical protein
LLGLFFDPWERVNMFSATPGFLWITWCCNQQNHTLQVRSSFCMNAAFLLQTNEYNKTNGCEFSIVIQSFSTLLETA